MSQQNIAGPEHIKYGRTNIEWDFLNPNAQLPFTINMNGQLFNENSISDMYKQLEQQFKPTTHYDRDLLYTDLMKAQITQYPAAFKAFTSLPPSSSFRDRDSYTDAAYAHDERLKIVHEQLLLEKYVRIGISQELASHLNATSNTTNPKIPPLSELLEGVQPAKTTTAIIASSKATNSDAANKFLEKLEARNQQLQERIKAPTAPTPTPAKTFLDRLVSTPLIIRVAKQKVSDYMQERKDKQELAQAKKGLSPEDLLKFETKYSELQETHSQLLEKEVKQNIEAIVAQSLSRIAQPPQSQTPTEVAKLVALTRQISATTPKSSQTTPFSRQDAQRGSNRINGSKGSKGSSIA